MRALIKTSFFTIRQMLWNLSILNSNTHKWPQLQSIGSLAPHIEHCEVISLEFWKMHNVTITLKTQTLHAKFSHISTKRSQIVWTNLIDIRKNMPKNEEYIYIYIYFWLSHDWVARAHGLRPQKLIVHLELGSKMPERIGKHVCNGWTWERHPFGQSSQKSHTSQNGYDSQIVYYPYKLKNV